MDSGTGVATAAGSSPAGPPGTTQAVATTYMAHAAAGAGSGAGAGGASAGASAAGGGTDAQPSPADKVVYVASDKNKDVILGVLAPRLSQAAVGTRPVRVIEIASGTGQHAAYFCKAMPHVEWTPTDLDDTLLRSIRAYAAEVANCCDPVRVDCGDTPWPVLPKGSPPRFHALLNVNMLHVSPPALVEALFRGAADVMLPDGRIFIYGPFKVNGEPTTPSNANFDASLRRRNPDWGLRDVSELETAASAYNFVLEEQLDVPTNNFVLVFRKNRGATGTSASAANLKASD